MKKQLLTLLTIAITSIAFAQEKPSYVFFGATEGAVFAKTDLDGTSDIYLNNGTVVLISAAIKGRYNDVFEVFYNKRKLYINKEDLKSPKISFNQLYDLPKNEKDSVSYYAEDSSTLLYDADMKELLGFLDKTKPSGIAVINWSYYDESEYTEGTSAKIQVYNPTKKTIKYIWFSFTGFNAVGDKVLSRGKSIKTVKAIGPIKPEETGSYEYSYVWLTDIVETAKITSIKVQYMDGTFKTVLNPKSVTLSKKMYELIKDNSIEED